MLALLVAIGSVVVVPGPGAAADPTAEPSLVANLDSSGGSEPTKLTAVGDTLFFLDTGAEGTGQELWKTSPEGTGLVKDIRPGPDSSGADRLTAIGHALYFTATDGVNGVELWTSDGTTAGTVMIKNINPSGDAKPFGMTTVGKKVLFFTENDGSGSRALWSTDGTEAGTALVRSPVGVRTTVPSDNQSILATGGNLFFAAFEGSGESELWKSDGTTAGTMKVKDIHPTFGSFPTRFVAVDDTVYFTANDGLHGFELWKSDGTEAGTVLVKDINRTGHSDNFIKASGLAWPAYVVGHTLMFVADDGEHGMELWKSDGSEAGTALVKDINPTAGRGIRSGSEWGFEEFATIGQSLYFTAEDADDFRADLWKSDGTEAGTVLVKDFSASSSDLPRKFVVVGSTLYFTPRTPETGRELWKSDGTAAGTVLVKDVTPGSGSVNEADNLTSASGTLYFSADDGFNGPELWKSDGTEAGTVLVTNNPAGNTFFGSGTAIGETLYFAAFAGQDAGLWKSNGSAEGTVLVKKLAKLPQSLTVVGNVLYFAADTIGGGTGKGLWKSDGTTEGTIPIKNMTQDNSATFSFAAMGDTVFFGTNYGVTGGELWKTDGTAPGTALVKDISAISGDFQGGGPYDLTTVGQTLFFVADGGGADSTDSTGLELWKSDGTTGGTTLVKDVYPGFVSSRPEQFTAANGKLFFVAEHPDHGVELWTSDGTPDGTKLVKNIQAGTLSGRPTHLRAVGGIVYFSANDGVTGRELWKTNGNPAHTVLVKDLNPGSANGYDSGGATAVGDRLFFAANNATHGTELWVSNGTAAGTTLVHDTNPVPAAGSNPTALTAVGDKLFFTANDGTHGVRLWRSNGTTSGTALIPSGGGSSPSGLTATSNTLYFNAQDLVFGRELWKLPLTQWLN